jgi:hypothetical protein
MGYRASRVTVNKLRHDVVNNVARSDKWPTLSAKVEVERDRSMVITLTVKEGACLAGLSHPQYKPGITALPQMWGQDGVKVEIRLSSS